MPDRSGIPASVGGDNHVGEGRQPRTVLPKYLKSGSPKQFLSFFHKLLIWRVAAVTAQLCAGQRHRQTLSPCPCARDECLDQGGDAGLCFP